MATKSDTLRQAKENKKDEFYTRLEDIEKEISEHMDYVRQFQGKTVLCNCDDPEWSNFFTFFKNHFNQLGIKKLITTHYNKDGSPSYKIEWSGERLNGDTINMITTPLKGDGDFRSPECIELLKEVDIVVTNPPFSLFREYVAQLIKYGKKFIIIGNNNAIAYKEIFPLLKEGKIVLGYNSNKTCAFRVGEDYRYDKELTKEINDGYHYGKVPAISWFTNFELDKSHEPLILNKNYKGNENNYPQYANFNAIEVNKISQIPKDYYGLMGVPITYMGQHCADQFEIMGMGSGALSKELGAIPYSELLTGKALQKMRDLRPNYGAVYLLDKNGMPKLPYNRIIIRRKKTV